MQRLRFIPLIATLALPVGTPPYAADFSAPVLHEKSTVVEYGHIQLSTPQGQYRYGIEVDERKSTSPFPVGKAGRDDYQFFSWQEEEALWYVLQDQLEQDAPPKAQRLKSAFSARVVWPRVVIRSPRTVCVPDLPQSKSDQWQDYLICTEVKELQQ